MELTIEATEAGIQTVRVRHPDGRDAVMKVLQDLLPAIEQVDRRIRAEPASSP